MATHTTTSPLLAGLDAAIAAVEAEARALQQQQAAREGAGAAVRGAPPPPPAMPAPGAPAPSPAPPGSVAPGSAARGGITDSQGRTLEDLAVFLARLKQMKEWLQDDDRLLPIVDEYIGQRVRAMEKRTNAVNTRLAIITTVAGAMLGWLTSLAQTPSALLHSLIH